MLISLLFGNKLRQTYCLPYRCTISSWYKSYNYSHPFHSIPSIRSCICATKQQSKNCWKTLSSYTAHKYPAMTDARNFGLPLTDVIKKLDAFAPKSLSESWDNVGLLVEPVTKKNIRRILLTNDLTEDVLEEAVRVCADLIISYHPPIFVPLKSVTTRSWKERVIAACLENRIAVYSPHTSFDAVSGGVNDWLASAFETESVKPLIQNDASDSRSKLYQVEIIVPVIETTESESVLYQIKNCAEERTRGTDDELICNICEAGGEMKLSVRCTLSSVSLLLDLFHSDVHKTGKEQFTVLKYEAVPPHGVGMGRLCFLKNPLQLVAVADLVKKHLALQNIRVALARHKHMESSVSTIGICAGSGSSVLNGVKADLYLTGEMQHHDILDAVHRGTHVILCDHSNTERGYLKVFAEKLATELCGGSVEVVLSETDRDPLQIM